MFTNHRLRTLALLAFMAGLIGLNTGNASPPGLIAAASDAQ